MKTVAISLAVIAAALIPVISIGAEPVFTWEGDVNPNEFNKWAIIGREASPLGPPTMIEVIKNPDPASPIKTVMAFIEYYDGTGYLVGYAYEKNDEVMVFRINADNTGYVRNNGCDPGRLPRLPPPDGAI